MIIVSMGAGLGNQLFEYAFYTCLKEIYPDQIIKLDVEYAFPVAHNGVEIFDIFDLERLIATEEEVMSLTKGHYLCGKGMGKPGVYERVYRRLGLRPRSMIIQDNYSEYYERFYNVGDGKSKYFLGAFANYAYFCNYPDLIKDLYVFPPMFEKHNKEYAKEITSCNSVSIHIRRGDYLASGANIVPLEYYNKAIGLLESKIEDIHFFVFSDDRDYAKKIFSKDDKFTIVDGNTKEKSYRDMQLMSMCKHNIITNSTFSFWAAYLNDNKNKIVVGPNIPVSEGHQLFTCEDWIILG